MSGGKHNNPQFGLRIPEKLMDKLKYIAEYNGRSANREIELTPGAYAFIRKRNFPRKTEEKGTAE